MARIRTLFPLAALALSGCISFGAKPPPSLLTLTASATMPAGTTRNAAAGQAITILPPRLPQALATNRVPVQNGDTSIAYVKDAQWVDSPNRLFRALLAETVSAKTGRLVLDNRQFSFDPGMTISGTLVHFGIDASTNEAVVTYDAARAVAGGTAVEERRFQARVPVSEIAADTVGVALNDAANRVAGEVAGWIGG